MCPNMFRSLEWDLEEAPIDVLLIKVSEKHWKNIDKIKRLNGDIKSLKDSNKELRERVTMFTDENIDLI